MHKLTTEEFLEKIFDYRNKQEWEFQGERPAVIDFYADWCAPCKMVSPILEELSKEYEGKVDFYKLNTDEEQEVAYVFGIRSIPSILFIPMNGKPQMATGAMPKEVYKNAIEEIFFGKKAEANAEE